MSQLENLRFSPLLLDRIRDCQKDIHRWLEGYEGSKELPLYSSVDIRDAGFKMAVVDTNLFPAGFNNLCEHGLADAVGFMRTAIRRRAPKARNILIISEEHTRNTWYLENVRILENIIREAGFQVQIATFLGDVTPRQCDDGAYIDLTTATAGTVRLYCFKQLLEDMRAGKRKFDLIIMNNDLIGGIPEVLQKSEIPIYPSLQAGWHSRLKSHHFCHTHDLMREFGKIVDIDPWLFSCLFAVINRVDVNVEADRERLHAAAVDILRRTRAKYEEHKIDGKPYLVLKADAGTYGMGVMTIEDPDEILSLNRKERNKLHVGKGANVISRYLLQEGVPTIYTIENQVSEAVIYQIESNLIGGFYRQHAHKGSRENLNAKGMGFAKMCPHLKKYGDCGIHHDINIFDMYRILARIAAIAAHREIIQLEARGQ